MSEDMRERYAEAIITDYLKDAPNAEIGEEERTAARELADAMLTVRDEEMERLRADLNAAIADNRELDEQLQELAGCELTATCTCYDGNPANYEGPRADCPVHGAVRAFNEERAATDRVRALHDFEEKEWFTPCDRHQPYTSGTENCPDCRTEVRRMCTHCTDFSGMAVRWPCPTVAALDTPSTPESPREDVGCEECRTSRARRVPGFRCGACRTVYPALGQPWRPPAPETSGGES